jgi:hypothetical protein
VLLGRWFAHPTSMTVHAMSAAMIHIRRAPFRWFDRSAGRAGELIPSPVSKG